MAWVGLPMLRPYSVALKIQECDILTRQLRRCHDCRAGRKVRRVLRGAAFNNEADNARCAYRNNDNPDNRNINIGFRVAVPHAIRALQNSAARNTKRREMRGRGKNSGATCTCPHAHGVNPT